MGFFKLCFVLLVSFVTTATYAQHDHGAAAATTPISMSPVLIQALSDPDLQNYKMESMVMTLLPNATDTVAHRHDCELFGYVIEGEVQIGLEKKAPSTFLAGQMFYERRNILHSLARNPSSDKSTKVLLIFLIKNGRVRYTPEYPKK
jgi:quercetin dioxygenase-like cupin family protein